MSISKDTALAEITLRRYEKPTGLTGRDLVRKLCLSLGLLQVGDTRDVIVDVLHVVLREKKEMDSEAIREAVVNLREQSNLALKGVASSNIRRQLKRLRDMHLIEKIANNYRVKEMVPLAETFRENVQGFLLPSILKRVNEYLDAVDQEFA